MAITKQVLHASGVIATYHRLLRYSIDFAPVGANPGVTGPLVTATFGEYLTDEHRNAGAQPARFETITFVMPIEKCNGNMREAIYSALLEPGAFYGEPLPVADPSLPPGASIVEA